MFSVFARFENEDRMTYRIWAVERGCRYILAAEGRKNWIVRCPRNPVKGFREVQKRLEASDVLKFMQTARSDVMNNAVELREETSWIKRSISSLLQGVTQFFEKEGQVSKAITENKVPGCIGGCSGTGVAF